MFRLSHLLIFTLLALTAQGCAGPPPGPVGAVSANTGIVYVSRESLYVGSLAVVSVRVDNVPVGSIANGQCIRLNLPAGKHTIHGVDALGGGLMSDLIGPGSSAVTVSVQPGQSIHVRIVPSFNLPGKYLSSGAMVTPSGPTC